MSALHPRHSRHTRSDQRLEPKKSSESLTLRDMPDAKQLEPNMMTTYNNHKTDAQHRTKPDHISTTNLASKTKTIPWRFLFRGPVSSMLCPAMIEVTEVSLWEIFLFHTGILITSVQYAAMPRPNEFRDFPMAHTFKGLQRKSRPGQSGPENLGSATQPRLETMCF